MREREKRDDESLFDDDDVCGRGENDDDVFYQSRREKRFVSKKTWSSKRGKSSGKKS